MPKTVRVQWWHLAIIFVLSFLTIMSLHSRRDSNNSDKTVTIVDRTEEDTYSGGHSHETTTTPAEEPSRQREPSSEPIIYDYSYVEWAREQYNSHRLVDSPPQSMIADSREMRGRHRWHEVEYDHDIGYYKLQMGAIEYLSTDGSTVMRGTIGGHEHFAHEGEIYTTLGASMWRTGLSPRR